MKKAIKKQKSVFDQKINYTYDERLDKITPSKGALEKTEEANKHLRKMKSLPKVD
jgi:hypothetical protein